MPDFGLSAGYFAVEMDGVTVLEATEVSGMEIDHEQFEFAVGTRAFPIYGRGKGKVNPLTIKHARALNNSEREIYAWFRDFVDGTAVERRNIRIVQLDEDGRTPIQTVDFIDCQPTKFKLEDHKGDAKDASMYTLEVQPSDIDFVA